MQTTLQKYLDPILKENIQLKKELHELKTTTQKDIERLQKDVAILKSQSVINMPKNGPQTQSSEKKVMLETCVDGNQKQYTQTYLSEKEDKPSTATELSSEISVSKEPLSHPAHRIEIVMDSHGNGLEPRRMYKNQDVNIHVLGAGKKNLDGVMQYVQSLKSPQHVVVGVGSNDIATKSPKSIVSQIENLVVCAQRNSAVYTSCLFSREWIKMTTTNASEM